MKVIYTLFNQASGKLAGIVAAHLPRGGNYTRERVIPKNPRTAGQSRVRAILASLSAAWTGTLSGVQRDNWNALGGGGPQGTGQNLYAAGNAILLQAGGTRVDNAPTGSATATFTPPAAADVVINPGSALCTIGGLSLTDDWQTADGGVCSVYISPRPQPAAHQSNAVGLTFAGSHIRSGAAVASFSVPLPNAQTAVAGRVYYVRVVTASADGKKSQEATYRILVVGVSATVLSSATYHTGTQKLNLVFSTVCHGSIGLNKTTVEDSVTELAFNNAFTFGSPDDDFDLSEYLGDLPLTHGAGTLDAEWSGTLLGLDGNPVRSYSGFPVTITT